MTSNASVETEQAEPRTARNLVLVGTVHSDPEGFEKTVRILESLRPDLILLELSPYGLTFRKKCQRSFLKRLGENVRRAARRNGISFKNAWRHPQIAGIRRQIGLPFEYRAAMLYAKKFPVRAVLVDDSSFSRRCIADWPELLTTRNLSILLSLPAEPSAVTDEYRTASQRIYGHVDMSLEVLSRKRNEAERHWMKRECYLATQVSIALTCFQPKKAVYLGGWWHLSKGSATPTLRDLLGASEDQCCLLEESCRLSHDRFSFVAPKSSDNIFRHCLSDESLSEGRRS